MIYIDNMGQIYEEDFSFREKNSNEKMNEDLFEKRACEESMK